MISVKSMDFDNISIDEYWNFSEKGDALMHSIHTYPAKFPAFIASKAFSYAQDEGVNINTVSDIFCGCGTVALEAKLHNKNFWGCDINPIATLIAKAKSASYKLSTFDKYYTQILEGYEGIVVADDIYQNANERLKYWFEKESYYELYRLNEAINSSIPNGKYQIAFVCIFSSMLKASSKWLTKSIKPQVDPNKNQIDVLKVFKQQCGRFKRAINELEDNTNKPIIEIRNQNFLSIRKLPKVDLIITSPPYVTSYEYADLHQLSSLWLGITEDYRDLREGTIGSIYNSEIVNIEIDQLNSVGQRIVRHLIMKDVPNSKIKAVTRYYSDMQKVIGKCAEMLNNAGMAFFVIGDTEYKGVKIMNSEHLVLSLKESGFKDIKVTKRRISNKLCIPYRDKEGRFSSDKKQREIYHEELIISGRIYINE